MRNKLLAQHVLVVADLPTIAPMLQNTPNSSEIHLFTHIFLISEYSCSFFRHSFKFYVHFQTSIQFPLTLRSTWHEAVAQVC